MRIAAAQLAYGEKFHDALFGLAQAVVPSVERLLHLAERDLGISRSFVPGQAEDPIEIRANDLILARRRRQHTKPLRFPARLLSHPLRQRGVVDLLEEIDRFLLSRIRLAQLRLNRPQLLAKIELALVLLDLHLGLLLHILHDPGAGHFAFQPRENEAHALPHIQPLQDFVLVGNPEVHVGSRQVGKAAGVRHVHLEDLRHFIRNAIHQIGERLGRAHDARHQIVEVMGIGRELLGRPHAGNHEGLVLLDRLDRYAAQPLQGDLDRVTGKVDSLMDPSGHANPSDKLAIVNRIIDVTRCDHEGDDQSGIFVRAQQREILRGAHLYGDRAERIDDGRAQRHER